MDAAAGLSLLLALTVVYGLDRLTAPAADGSTAESLSVVEESVQGTSATAPVQSLRLAVTPHEYDDMGKLLESLGAGYAYKNIRFEDLLYADRLLEYDVVFLTCGGVPKQWLGRKVAGGLRDSAGTFQIRPRIATQLRSNLRAFVGQGGTLYISDWQILLLDAAFPEFIDRAGWNEGQVQTVKAEVVDPGLARLLGKKLDMRFDKPGWYAAAVKGPDATTYLRGSYTVGGGRRVDGPLLVKVPFQQGAIVFTSFHNEAQNSQVELELLRYLVFATVTAKEEARVKRTMLSGGFSPQERSLLSVSAGTTPVEQEYECPAAADLQFVLGFAQGARLQLQITAPDGTHHESSGTQTFQIDIPTAPAGTWRYTITPIEVPYQNFPFTLTIGEKH